MQEQSRRSFLRVVEGGAQTAPSWRQIPSIVIGRSPFDRTAVTSFRVGTQDVQKALANHRKQPLLDLWACVIGELPGFAGVERYLEEFNEARTALSQAHACFQGLKRPIGDDDHGFDVVAFVTKPKMTFSYSPDFGCMIKPKRIPNDLVLVTYAQLDRDCGTANQRPKLSATGMVIHWEFVEADATDLSLPIGFGERYRKRHW
jgi:hypothetical protein